MVRIFLSHASADDGLAFQVRDWLVAGGYDVFLDCDPDPGGGIESGGLWKEHLYERLRWASVLVCLVTDAYITSQWCFGEIVAARVVGCPIVPLAGQVTAIHPLLAEHQHISVYGAAEPAGRRRLLAYLREYDIPGAAGWPDGRSPFPGLRPFEPDMHQAFFGRQTETDALVRSLRSAVERDDRHVLVVVGPSGCGKSSLVRAGVMAAMSREAGWAVLPVVSPGPLPLTALARAFAQAMPASAAWVASRVRDRLSTDGLLEVASDYLTARRGLPAAQLLLVVDQFEEVLTRADADARQQLAATLVAAVDAGVVRVLTTMRSEFLDPLLASSEFTELPVRSFPLRPLDPKMLPTVIEAPMRLAGLRVAPELVSRIVAETDSGECLPLLAYTLQEATMGMRRGAELTAQHYDSCGGVRGTLIREADAALAEAVAVGGRSESDVLRTLLRMVTVDHNGNSSRREAAYHLFSRASKVEVDTFVRRRLLTTRSDHTTDEDAVAPAVSIAVAHEAFLSQWPPLAKMVDSHRAALQMRVTVEDAATVWTASGWHRSYLWDRTRLAGGVATLGVALRRPALFRPLRRSIEAIRLMVLSGPIVDLSSRAVEFIVSSVRRNHQRRRRVVIMVATLLTVSLALTGIALVQRQEAVEQRERAVAQQRIATQQQQAATARELMLRAEQRRGSDTYEALKLGLAAEQLDSNPSTRASLVATLVSTTQTATVPDDQGVTAVAFSPDGHTIAITTFGDHGGFMQLWDVTSSHAATRIATVSVSGQQATAVAFRPDGRRIAITTLGGWGTVELWDVTNAHKPVRTAVAYNPHPTAVAFSHDGRTLVTISGDSISVGRSVQLWDVTNSYRMFRTSIATVASFDQKITALALSPDGHTIAATTANTIHGGIGGTVQLWDVTNPHAPTRVAMATDNRDVTAVAFSRDGHLLATATATATELSGGIGGTVQLWDVTDPRAPTRTATVTENQDLTALAFSRDGHVLGTATAISGDIGGTVQLWDVSNPQAPVRATAATIAADQDVTALVFSPNENTLAITTAATFGATGGTVQLWDTTEPHAPTRTATATVSDDQRVTAVAFSPDGRILATTTAATTAIFRGVGGSVQLWDATDRHAPTRTAAVADKQNVTAVAFSPDRRTLATISDRPGDLYTTPIGTAQLWDVTNPYTPTRVTTVADDQYVTAVAFSPDGSTLATTTRGGGGMVQVWDMTNPHVPARTTTIADDQYVTAMAFSPDGGTLVAATAGDIRGGGSIRLWDLDRHVNTSSVAIPGSQNVTTVTLSPDGRTLAAIITNSNGVGGTLQLWDVTDRRTPTSAAVIPDNQSMTAMTFSPDGRTFAITTSDPTGGGGTAQLWDITNPFEPTRTAAVVDNQNMTAVAFSPDGQALVTTTSDAAGGGTVQLWDVAWITALSGQIRNWSCRASGGGLTVDEWSRSVPGIPFRDTC